MDRPVNELGNGIPPLTCSPLTWWEGKGRGCEMGQPTCARGTPKGERGRRTAQPCPGAGRQCGSAAPAGRTLGQTHRRPPLLPLRAPRRLRRRRRQRRTGPGVRAAGGPFRPSGRRRRRWRAGGGGLGRERGSSPSGRRGGAGVLRGPRDRRALGRRARRRLPVEGGRAGGGKMGAGRRTRATGRPGLAHARQATLA